jgi:hypothetical protein
MADQIDGLGGVRDIAAIDQRGLVALEKQNLLADSQPRSRTSSESGRRTVIRDCPGRWSRVRGRRWG